MDRKDVAATVIASAAVIALSAVFVWTVLSRMSGEIEAGPFVNMCVSLTMILSFVVLIYGAYMMRDSGSSRKRYEEYALRRKEEEDDGSRGRRARQMDRCSNRLIIQMTLRYPIYMERKNMMVMGGVAAAIVVILVAMFFINH